MKIIGLFIVVFGCFFVNKLVGFSFEASTIGTIVGTGSYLLITLGSS